MTDAASELDFEELEIDYGEKKKFSVPMPYQIVDDSKNQYSVKISWNEKISF